MKNKNILLASIASLVVTALAFVFVARKRKAADKPPRNAPQLPLQNPGDQSDFPAGPTTEPSLG